MTAKLEISFGSYSDKGIKTDNDDYLSAFIPAGYALSSKGIVIAIADGMSSSEAGKEASQACVNGFINDYYSTPDSWTVQKAAAKILSALNSWLYSRGHSDYQSARGMVTTITILILKSTTAHIFHVGDSRVYRYRDNVLEQLTRDHRIWVSADRSYLNRAIGIDLHLDIDYRKVSMEKGDQFLLSTDGIHDFLTLKKIRKLLHHPLDKDLSAQCQCIAEQALENACDDNLSLQLLQIDKLPLSREEEVYQKAGELPFPPPLEPGVIMDGYQIVAEIHASKRTQIYLAHEQNTQKKVILKTPSVNYNDDPQYIEQFLHEEWAGKRISSPYVLTVITPPLKPHFLYYVTEYLEGITLREWMQQNPLPPINTVIPIVEQIAKGLRAFHRLEMLHQDLKPDNIIIDPENNIKIIDFGSVKIAGISELAGHHPDDDPLPGEQILGTLNYSAPEFHLGQSGDERSDLYSLAVISYEMLNGKLPFDKELSEKASMRQLSQLKYISSINLNPMVPNWMDGAIKKALSLDIKLRQADVFEFLYDLEHPNPHLLSTSSIPLIERNPLIVWRTISMLSLIANLILLYFLVK